MRSLWSDETEEKSKEEEKIVFEVRADTLMYLP